MDAAKRAKLEAMGCTIYDDAADAVGLDEVERKRLDLHSKLANAIRRLRIRRGLTQEQFAKMLKTSRPRITDIELGIASLDQCVKALFMLGGSMADLETLGHALTTDERSQAAVKRGRKPKAAGKA